VAKLVLGPLLRYTGATDATIWVQADAACTVTVCGCDAPTFEVAGRHFALVHVTGLEPEETRPYEVELDGERVWPEEGSAYPPSVIRTVTDDHGLRIAFGSCRVAVPHEPPYDLTKDEDDRGREHDALYALARDMAKTPTEDWPHLLVMLGDQIYADEVDPATRAWIRRRRDPDVPPGEQLANFDEYCHAYGVSWGDPGVRWLLSTMPTAMIFDDHDVHDDWNTARSWVQKMRAKGWWDERIVGAFMSYWLFQHVGNLAPDALEDDWVFCAVRDCEGDAAPILREFAFDADRDTEGSRWSYCRDIGRTRLIVMDSRGGRVLRPGERSMVDPDEWRWIVDHSQGSFDHLLYATSLPVFLGRGMHYLEAFDEAVSDGKWGSLAARRIGESLREALDLEHWPAFSDSFRRVEDLLEDVAAGRAGGAAPGSIVLLSGDVHHAYVADVSFPAGSAATAPVYQAVCSPMRNPLDSN
jgi:hypothetical protein